MTATATDYLYTVRIGATDHLSEEHPSLGGALTLCGLTIAGTPEGPWSYYTCTTCAERAGQAPEQGGDIAMRHLERAVEALAQVTEPTLAEVVAPELARLREALEKIDAGEL